MRYIKVSNQKSRFRGTLKTQIDNKTSRKVTVCYGYLLPVFVEGAKLTSDFFLYPLSFCCVCFLGFICVSGCEMGFSCVFFCLVLSQNVGESRSEFRELCCGRIRWRRIVLGEVNIPYLKSQMLFRLAFELKLSPSLRCCHFMVSWSGTWVVAFCQ